jgi:CDP-paratose 2-epimerase
MKTWLVTGGAGFVGSSLAIRLKRDHADTHVVALDNLKRRGSELNVERLRANGVEFVHGDVRNPGDLRVGPTIDGVIECSAEPSVRAGYDTSPEYVTQTNLGGVLHCLELARQHDAAFILLSTSRVYPIRALNNLAVAETPTRYELLDAQPFAGASAAGVTEQFPLEGTRSLYGATKLAAELIVAEYVDMFGVRAVINRCGVVAGPWQMGKVDQGIVAFWLARHILGGALRYTGYGGHGKQVRDVLHVDDLYAAIDLQIQRVGELKGEAFNLGGGRDCSVSLLELHALCGESTGVRLQPEAVAETHPSDVRVYLSDCRKLHERTGWVRRRSAVDIVEETARWIMDHRRELEGVLA